MIQITGKIRITRLDKLNLQLETLEPVNKKDGTVANEWKWHGYYGKIHIKRWVYWILPCTFLISQRRYHGCENRVRHTDHPVPRPHRVGKTHIPDH